ncbi:hypothetical protein [Bradyrhizobium japonicum]|uniref:hypothetical protein n=1 Tax=Bradyrhizobium japonicum TaxID=375 RepID=UPI0020A1615C|nr:hypothetical protein [Bradyrhizobium japonicum]MCP1765149.1 hypothetical protein [Bradyrhizobium japonicum]MCP1787286.1 hypothetical protein [Bradyrhizobium japonicum]MCP1809163.1 hypothetical protein [Bradyrhizobium japonicum]MCP1818096.1 hypothetical protein [Bradyrhizobium japonicum]MCP1870395.1 hypothetical protein [Bradyrhizobium japonicum]
MSLYDATSGGATAPTVLSIEGRKLSRRVSKLDAANRALLAHSLERGSLHLLNPTRKQAAALARVSACYVGALNRASSDERRALEQGALSLSALQHRRRPMTDDDVERVVKRFGISRIFAVIDRLTAPQHMEAAE